MESTEIIGARVDENLKALCLKNNWQLSEKDKAEFKHNMLNDILDFEERRRKVVENNYRELNETVFLLRAGSKNLV